MSNSDSSSKTEPKAKQQKNENDNNKIWIALIFLLLSFSCIFCSSQTALWLIGEDQVEASMLTGRMADYSGDGDFAAAPLDRNALATQVHQDGTVLRQTVTILGMGDEIVQFPTPPPLPSATPISIAVLPTPTPTLTPSPAPVPPTPAPTSAPPTSVRPTSAPPTSIPATSVPPTSVPPTPIPPTPIPPTPTPIPPTPIPPTPIPPTPTNSPPANNPPNAVDDTVSTDEDTAVLINVLSNDTDSDGTLRPNTLAIVTGPSNGSASINGNRINYTPNANYHGADSFVYRICDNDGACDTATVSITVRDINDAPIAVDDTANTSVGTPVTIAVLSNDYDPDGDPISVAAVGTSAGGAVGFVGNTVVYTPTVNGTHTFTYTIEDTSGLTDDAVITVIVIAPPVAVDDTADTAEDIPVIIDVLDNDSDPDGDPLTVTFASTPLSGTTTINVPGYTVTYVPDPDYNGTDTFTYTISDGIFTDTATVVITILAVNDLPVAVDDSYSTRITSPTLTIPAPGLLDNDTDVDGDSLTVNLSSVSTPTGGASVGVNADGSFIFYNYSSIGDYTFTYQALDSSLASSNVAAVTVTVTP